MVTNAYLMVRAVLTEVADRPRFDSWYEAEHLPDAVARFGATRGWRCWSRTDPSVHYAFYEFPDVAQAHAILGSPGLQVLVAEFDRVWAPSVTRTRDILETVGTPKSAPG